MGFSFKSIPIAVVIAIGMIIAGNMVFQIAGSKEKASLIINSRTISAYVARSESEKARGLSGRLGLKKNEGMLFIFEAAERYGFWMKDIRFPIDIIWIRDRKIVGLEKNIPPPISNGFAYGDQNLKILGLTQKRKS